MASPSLESFLHPGEEIRFEAHARGWAPLDARVVILYALILGFAAALALPGKPIDWPVGNTHVPIPIEVPAVALVLLIEVYRMTEFRSRVHAVTSHRVLLVYGVFRTKLWHWVPVTAVTSAQLVRGVPTLHLDGGRWELPGLDALDVESMAAALHVPVSPVIEPGALRRHGRRLAIVAAVLFVVTVEVEAALQRRARVGFNLQWSRAQKALLATERAMVAMSIARGRQFRSVSWGSASFDGLLSRHSESSQAYEEQGTERAYFRVGFECSLDFSFVPAVPPISVRLEGADPFFAAELKRAFADDGVVATWAETR